jgi:hypothetical protein
MSYKTLHSINNVQNNGLKFPPPVRNIKENFIAPHYPVRNIKENFITPQYPVNIIKEDFIAPPHRFEKNTPDMYPKVNPNYISKDEIKDIQTEPKVLDIKYEIVDSFSTVSPPIFGPPLWFSLHNAAAHYPDNPSPITKERMKHIILGIPVLTPCANCSEHASSYIEKHYDQLDRICSGRDPLFKFFVDFHNYVNERYNKPIMSYEDAYKIYLGNAKVTRMTYN